MGHLAASTVAWAAIVAFTAVLNAGLTWSLEQTGSWFDRVRTKRLDPLRELRRWVEAALALGLAGAIAARTGWPFWAVAAVLLAWPLRLVREIRTAVPLARKPEDTLALHERGFLADTYGPLPTRAAVVLLALALYVGVPSARVSLDWLAGLPVRAAWRLLGA